MAGLYVHIPFCSRKCGYCDFFSVPAAGRDLSRFIELLDVEIALAAADRAFAPAATVFFGGGTPSLLAPEAAAGVLDRLASCFGLEPGAEVTLEANPGTVDERSLSGFREAGFNRLSLGVQSFEAEELEALERLHTADQALGAFAAARRAGFGNAALDLIFGIPGQTPESWSRTLDTAVSLDPEHLSAYALTVHPDTPLARSLRSGAVRLPDDDELADLYQIACGRLGSAGFGHYEVSNFAKPGFRSRHNEGYWTFEPYRGLGPSAHSFKEGVRFWNEPGLDPWSAALEKGRLPVAGSENVGGEKHGLEALALGLRREEGVVMGGLDEGKSPVSDMVRNGLAESGAGRLRPTEAGFLVADAMALELSEAGWRPESQ